MKHKQILASLLLLPVLGVPALAAGSLPGPAFPKFNSAAQVDAACTAGLSAAKQRVAALERRSVNAGWLAAFDDFYAFLEDTQYPLEFVLNVHPDAVVREAAQACSLRWANFSSTLSRTPSFTGR
ncbi:hypothetical protein ACVBEH_05240 [Roseateles sp. GG27B]